MAITTVHDYMWISGAMVGANKRTIMMNSFKQWWYAYNTEITWFLIGWCTLAGIHALAQGNLVSAAINFLVAFVNYKLR